MTIETKTALIALPTLTAISPAWGIAMGLGMLGGWLARAALHVEAEKEWKEIRKDMLVSLMVSGGSVLATLFFAKLAEADELGVAAIGFAMAASGTKVVSILRDYIVAPITAAIQKSGEPK